MQNMVLIKRKLKGYVKIKKDQIYLFFFSNFIEEIHHIGITKLHK